MPVQPIRRVAVVAAAAVCGLATPACVGSGASSLRQPASEVTVNRDGTVTKTWRAVNGDYSSVTLAPAKEQIPPHLQVGRGEPRSHLKIHVALNVKMSNWAPRDLGLLINDTITYCKEWKAPDLFSPHSTMLWFDNNVKPGDYKIKVINRMAMPEEALLNCTLHPGCFYDLMVSCTGDGTEFDLQEE